MSKQHRNRENSLGLSPACDLTGLVTKCHVQRCLVAHPDPTQPPSQCHQRPLGLGISRGGTHHGQEGALREAGVEGDELGPGTALTPHEAAVEWGNSWGYGLGNSPIPQGIWGVWGLMGNSKFQGIGGVWDLRACTGKGQTYPNLLQQTHTHTKPPAMNPNPPQTCSNNPKPPCNEPKAPLQ